MDAWREMLQIKHQLHISLLQRIRCKRKMPQLYLILLAKVMMDFK